MLSNYTIMHDKTKLEQKKGKNAKKVKWTRIPLGGMGSGLERAYSKIFFFIIKGYNNQQTNLHFGPCYLGSKGLQQACNKLK